jgi:hypothetical protein
MLVVQTIGRIRREHFVKGKSIREIVRELKVSRNAVRKGSAAHRDSPTPGTSQGRGSSPVPVLSTMP